MSSNIKKQEILKHLVILFKNDTKLVLEGIETREDMEVALELGLDYGQGYYLGQPLPRNEQKLTEKRSQYQGVIL